MLEILKALFIPFYYLGKAIITVFIDLLSIPTSPYGLVKFLVSKDIIFHSETLTRILVLLASVLVSLLVSLIAKTIGDKDKNGSGYGLISIVLFLLIMTLFSSWVFWLVIGIIVILIVLYAILNKQKRFE